MAKIRGLDSNGDWKFGAGIQSYFKQAKALETDIITRILSWAEDCFFDKEANVDWKNLLDYHTHEQLKNTIKTVILQTNGVLKLNSISLTRQADRVVLIEANIDTIYTENVDFSLSAP